MLWNRKGSSEQQEGNNDFQIREEKFHAELERKNQVILQLKEKEFNLREENEELLRKIAKHERIEENITKELKEREQEIEDLNSHIGELNSQIEELESQIKAYERKDLENKNAYQQRELENIEAYRKKELEIIANYRQKELEIVQEYQQKELKLNKQLEAEKQKIQELKKKIALLEEKEKQYQKNISSMTQNLSRQMKSITAAKQKANQSAQGQQYAQLPTHCSRGQGNSNYPNYQTMNKIANAINSHGATSASGRSASIPNMKGIIPPNQNAANTVQFNPFRYVQGR
jgi:chromosome segregation ATPase